MLVLVSEVVVVKIILDVSIYCYNVYEHTQKFWKEMQDTFNSKKDAKKEMQLGGYLEQRQGR